MIGEHGSWHLGSKEETSVPDAVEVNLLFSNYAHFFLYADKYLISYCTEHDRSRNI